MFTLTRDKSKYFRIKSGQTREEVENLLCVPVSGGFFCGGIVETDKKYTVHEVAPHESYESISRAFGISDGLLRKVNGNKTLYPTLRLFIPC